MMTRIRDALGQNVPGRFSSLVMSLLAMGGLLLAGCIFATNRFFCELPGECSGSGRLLYSSGRGGIGALTSIWPALFIDAGSARIRGFSFAETPGGGRIFVAADDALREYDAELFSKLHNRILIQQCIGMGDVAVLEDGNVVVTCPENERLVKIDPSSGNVVTGFSCCEGVETSFRPFAIALGPNETVLAGTTQINAFDVHTGDFLGVAVPAGINGATSYNDLVFGPDGHLFVSANPDVGVLEFDGTTFELLRVFVPAGTQGLDVPAALAFSAQGNLFVGSASAVEGLILEFDGQTGEFVREVMRKRHYGPVSFMAFHP